MKWTGLCLTLAGLLFGQASGDGNSTWTTGAKTLLFIRLNFPDDLTDPQSASDAASMMQQASDWFQHCSYGKTWLVTTVTPLYTLPQNRAHYVNAPWLIDDDAWALAQAGGYNRAAYDLYICRYVAGGRSDGSLGSPGVDLDQYPGDVYLGTLCHELGHNFGLHHANLWQTTDGSVIGAGYNVEYGDPFDVMASSLGEYNTYEKNLLGWIPDAQVLTVTSSGTYRIHAFDQGLLGDADTYALKIVKDINSNVGERDYWVDFRQAVTSNPSAMNGALIHWGAWSMSDGGSDLLNMNPGESAADAALMIGRTFSDPDAGVYITPVGKGGTSPESLDVVVNIGNFAGNHAPVASLYADHYHPEDSQAVTLTVLAQDPDGDALAYGWDFGDGLPWPNSPSVTRSFPAGSHMVRCVVSDMKGGVAVASCTLNVRERRGHSSWISGRVVSAGTPVEGARITAENAAGKSQSTAYTAPDGTYTLAGLRPGSYTVNATKDQQNFQPSDFTNPVDLGQYATCDFVETNPVAASASGAALRAPRPAAATSQISGEVTGVDASVTVACGGRSTRTVEVGGKWLYILKNVPAGSWMLSARRNGYAIAPAGFSNPVVVTGANLEGRNFKGALSTSWSQSESTR